MARPKTIVSKSMAAKALGVTPGRVTQLIEKGMPSRPDGRLDVEKCKRWYRENIVPRAEKPERGDTTAPASRRAPTVTSSAGEPTAREVLGIVGEWRHRIPELLFAMGFPLRAALLGSDLIDGLLCVPLGNAVDRLFGVGNGPGREGHDFVVLAERLGVSVSELEAAYLHDSAWDDAIGEFFEGNPNFAEGLEPLFKFRDHE